MVRVSPRVPLEMLLPAVCDKCEFQAETTVLLRDSQSKEPLDLTKTLNDHGLREVFAKDTAAREPVDHQRQPKTPEAGMLEDPLQHTVHCMPALLKIKSIFLPYSSNLKIRIKKDFF